MTQVHRTMNQGVMKMGIYAYHSLTPFPFSKGKGKSVGEWGENRCKEIDMLKTTRVTIQSVVVKCLKSNWDMKWEEMQKEVLKVFPHSRFSSTHLPWYKRAILDGRISFPDKDIPKVAMAKEDARLKRKMDANKAEVAAKTGKKKGKKSKASKKVDEKVLASSKTGDAKAEELKGGEASA